MSIIIFLLFLLIVCVVLICHALNHNEKFFAGLNILFSCIILFFILCELKRISYKENYSPYIYQKVEIITYKQLKNGIEIPIDTFYQTNKLIF